MGRPVWFVELIKKAFPNRFAVGKLTKWPIIGPAMDRWLSEGDDLIYLPTNAVIRIDEPLDPPEHTVLPSQIVDHFIEQASHHWLMNRCIPSRSASPCLPEKSKRRISGKTSAAPS